MMASVRAILVASALVVLGAGMPYAADDAQTIKLLMGDNFKKIQEILVDLITSNYGTLSHDVDGIRRHAESLAQSPPTTIKAADERMMFIGYATSLRNSATALIAVTDELIRRDKEREASGALKVDYLRADAALHYGSMITQCVLCHNQFRRYIVPAK